MDLKECRAQLDKVDDEILFLFLKRLEIVKDVAKYKVQNNLPILNSSREEEILKRIERLSDKESSVYTKTLFENIMDISKEYQNDLINK